MKQVFELSPKTDQTWQEFSAALAAVQGGECVITIESKKQRTKPQNRSIHKVCRMLSEGLNNKGQYMVRALKVLRKSPEVEIPWTPEEVKRLLWRPVQKAMFDTESTTELSTIQVSQVFEVLNKNLAEKLGVSCEFPSRHGD